MASSMRMNDSVIPAAVPPVNKKLIWVNNLGQINTIDANGIITIGGFHSGRHIKLNRDLSIADAVSSDINTALSKLNVFPAKTFNIAMDANMLLFDLIGLDGLEDLSFNPLQTHGFDVILNFIQPAGGARTITFGPSVIFPTNFGFTQLNGAPNSIDTAHLTYDQNLDKFKMISFLHGYNI